MGGQKKNGKQNFGFIVVVGREKREREEFKGKREGSGGENEGGKLGNKRLPPAKSERWDESD